MNDLVGITEMLFISEENFFEAPIKTMQRPGCFVEAILEDGPNHTIRVILEKDGPMWERLNTRYE